MSADMIGLHLLQPAPWNPRGAIDDASLGELVESVRSQGILTPLLVRQVNNHYEIVAGHRRFRAAQLADLAVVPATIRELSDDDARTVAIVENLQRADVHPLDEAHGYRDLQQAAHLSVEDLAARVGKSRAYIAQRMVLCALVDEAAVAYRDGRIQLGHAQLIANLTPTDQQKALAYALGPSGAPDRYRPTVSQLSDWIEQQVLQDLTQAIWPLDDPAVVSDAPACSDCPRRGGLDVGLFVETGVRDDDAGWCADGSCFVRKQVAWLTLVEQRESRAAGLEAVRVSNMAYGKVPKKVLGPGAYSQLSDRAPACPATRLAVVVHGHRLGTTFRACVADTCQPHGRKPAPKPEAGVSREELVAQRKEEDEQRERVSKARLALATAVIAAASWPLPSALLAEVEAKLDADAEDWDLPLPAKSKGLDRLAQRLVRAFVSENAERTWDPNTRDLDLAARALKVSAVAKPVQKEPAEKSPAKKVTKATAKPTKAATGKKR
jgi:ParB family transcriptional regulator, chromosome partitioning protein